MAINNLLSLKCLTLNTNLFMKEVAQPDLLQNLPRLNEFNFLLEYNPDFSGKNISEQAILKTLQHYSQENQLHQLHKIGLGYFRKDYNKLKNINWINSQLTNRFTTLFPIDTIFEYYIETTNRHRLSTCFASLQVLNICFGPWNITLFSLAQYLTSLKQLIHLKMRIDFICDIIKANEPEQEKQIIPQLPSIQLFSLRISNGNEKLLKIFPFANLFPNLQLLDIVDLSDAFLCPQLTNGNNKLETILETQFYQEQKLNIWQFQVCRWLQQQQFKNKCHHLKQIMAKHLDCPGVLFHWKADQL